MAKMRSTGQSTGATKTLNLSQEFDLKGSLKRSPPSKRRTTHGWLEALERSGMPAAEPPASQPHLDPAAVIRSRPYLAALVGQGRP
jgi:hypothetical protein